MSDRTTPPGHSGGRGAGEPHATDTEEIAAMMRSVLREQERHREGGVEPELEAADAEPSRDSAE